VLSVYIPGHSWRILVPRFTFQLSSVRRLLIPAVTVEKRLPHTFSRNSAPKALSLPTSVLIDIVDGKTPDVESLSVSLIGWIIQVFHSDHHAGVVHIEEARHTWKKSNLKPRHGVTTPPTVYTQRST